jgi:hypothetical protein
MNYLSASRLATENPTALSTLLGANQDYPFIFSFPLTCPNNIRVAEGVKWRDITVGKATLDDLQELYGVLAIYPVPSSGNTFAPTYNISLTETASRQRKLAQTAEICLVNRKIAALALTLNNEEQLSIFLRDWLTKYGKPDIVTWAKGWGLQYRTLIWSKSGIALLVDAHAVDLEPRAVFASVVVFYPPTQPPIDWAQWPYAGLTYTPVDVPNDAGYPTKENPFDFDLIFGTATAPKANDK